MAERDAPPRPELEALFDRWDKQRATAVPGEVLGTAEPIDPEMEQLAARMGVRKVDIVHLLGTFTVLLTALCAWGMMRMASDVQYWAFGGDAPMELTDLRTQWKAGERTLELPSNTWVHFHGLLTTYEFVPDADASAQALADGRGTLPWFFVCPIFDIVVKTQQPMLEKSIGRHVEVDAGLIGLVQDRRAHPSDLAVAMGGEGRLVRSVDLPTGEREVVARVAHSARLNPREVWVFIDGRSPSSYTNLAIAWFMLPLIPLTSLVLFLLGWRRRRRES